MKRMWKCKYSRYFYEYFFVCSFSALLLYEDYLRFPCRYYLPRRVFVGLLDFPRYKTSCCTTVWTCWCTKYIINSCSLYIEIYKNWFIAQGIFKRFFGAFSTWRWLSLSPRDWWYAEYDWWSEQVRCLNYMPTERCRYHLRWFAHLHWSLHTIKWKIILLKVQYKNL